MARTMKASGIEWIGAIPAHWKVSRLKNLFSFGKGLPITKENLTETGIPVISYGQIHGKYNTGVRVHNELIRFVPESYLSTNPESLVHEGDLILADTSEDVEGCGNCAYIDRGGQIFAGYHTIILKADTPKDNKYIAYLLKTDPWRSQIRSKVSGVKVFSISRRIMSDATVILPPENEQFRIATFLDRRCAEIDSVISETEKTIEEYKTLKQSIITEAVTKGVRGKRPMKDSGTGIEKEIPVDWQSSPIKYVAKFQPACDTSDLSENSEITYTPMDFIKNGYYVQNTAKYGSVTPSLTPFKEGDIAMAKVTPCFENGNIAIMEGLASGFGMGSSELFVYRPISVNPRFLLYWLQNDKFKDEACATMTGTGGLKRVSPYYAKNAEILLPPKEEQTEIVAFLDKKCAEIDRLIQSKQQLLDHLANYKKSVIYEYVTGKKEVPACQ